MEGVESELFVVMETDGGSLLWCVWAMVEDVSSSAGVFGVVL